MKKLLRLLKRRKKNSGFTLVEMIISCALLGILVVGITVFITPVLKAAGTNEVDVRGTLLADTVNNYISRSTRIANYVKVFTNADREDAYEGGDIAEDEDIKSMMQYVKKATYPDGRPIMELKCISFTWANDPQTQENKYMVMNETFKNSISTAINTEPIRVFEDCFYEGLFPTFTIEQLKGTDVAPTKSDSGDSSESDSESTPEEETLVPAIKLTTAVSSDPEMKNADFIGVGFTEYGQIKNKQINASGEFQFYKTRDMERTGEHNTTFIYFVVRRTFAY